MYQGYRIAEVDPARHETAAMIRSLDNKTEPDSIPLDLSQGFWWMAFNGPRPVGFACMTKSEWFEATGYLSRAGVLPADRGNGLQKRLIHARMKKARCLGWSWLVSATDVKNPASANSLISCGFRMYWPKSPWYESAVFWRLNLDKK